MCDLLQILITEHHSLYIKLFGPCLKPKHHHITHYADIIRNIGPLIHIWCMRYESKHRQSKLAANVVSSRVNIAHTLAIKHQLTLSNRLITNEGFSSKFLSGPTISWPDFDKSTFSKNVLELLLRYNFNNEVFKTSWVQIFGTKYKEEDIILISTDSELPLFGIIQHIFVNSCQRIIFLCMKLQAVCFNEQVYAYQVQHLPNDIVLIMQDDLPDSNLQLGALLADGNYYVCPRTFY